MLFTHKGYSGPAVLDLSHHVIMALENQAQIVPGQQIVGRLCTLHWECTAQHQQLTVYLQPLEPTGWGSPWSTGKPSCSKEALHLHRQYSARLACHSAWQRLYAGRQAAMKHSCPS